MDIKNSCDVEEDDWENAIIPDLISERERKLIEDRKKVEEADGILVEELFSDFQKKIVYNLDNKQIILNKKEKPKDLENRRETLIKNQKQKSELIRKMKAEKKRIFEIYGDAELDEYDEVYGSIQDKY